MWLSISFELLLPGEVCHLHHDHTHLFGQHNDVIAIVIPLGHFSIQLALLLSEALYLLSNLSLFFLGKLSHDGLEVMETETLLENKWNLEKNAGRRSEE